MISHRTASASCWPAGQGDGGHCPWVGGPQRLRQGMLSLRRQRFATHLPNAARDPSLSVGFDSSGTSRSEAEGHGSSASHILVRFEWSDRTWAKPGRNHVVHGSNRSALPSKANLRRYGIDPNSFSKNRQCRTLVNSSTPARPPTNRLVDQVTDPRPRTHRGNCQQPGCDKASSVCSHRNREVPLGTT